MSVDVTFDKVCAALSALLRADCQLTVEPPGAEFTPRGAPEVKATLERETYDTHAACFQGDAIRVVGDTALIEKTSYEALVSDESRYTLSPIRDPGPIEKHDLDADIRYRLGPPSDRFVLFLLSTLIDPARRPYPVSPMRLRRFAERGTASSVFELFRFAFPRLLTVAVSTGTKSVRHPLQKLANAFLFQLTYNLNAPFVEARSLEEFVYAARFLDSRRSNASDIEPPKRVYIADLTYHYQLGLSADSPVLEYLSFYHVAEHFFEAVFQDDLIEAITRHITRPEFSHRRRDDVQGLIREITKRQRIREDAITFNEQEALRLTLVRYVPMPELRAKLFAADPGLAAYYRTARVSFSDGDQVDLGSDEGKAYASLARRIYKTRNSIVHSKDGDKARFVPFQHDKELAKEIPLIRVVAEEIVIASSTQL